MIPMEEQVLLSLPAELDLQNGKSLPARAVLLTKSRITVDHNTYSLNGAKKVELKEELINQKWDSIQYNLACVIGFVGLLTLFDSRFSAYGIILLIISAYLVWTKKSSPKKYEIS